MLLSYGHIKSLICIKGMPKGRVVIRSNAKLKAAAYVFSGTIILIQKL